MEEQAEEKKREPGQKEEGKEQERGQKEWAAHEQEEQGMHHQ